MSIARWRFAALASAMCATALTDRAARGAEPRPPAERIAVFAQSIDPESVTRFIDANAERELERVVLDSPGGEIRSAMRLANWIADRRLDVEVRTVCASSCANYLFAAGQRKVIDDGAIVVWHGSALQEDFREMLEDCPRRIRTFESATGDFPERYDSDLLLERALCTYFAEATKEQGEFFLRVGASEYITRLGQEPRAFGLPWTVPVETMRRLGYHDVEAPDDYASIVYMARFNASGRIPEPVLSLALRDDGSVVEVAR